MKSIFKLRRLLRRVFPRAHANETNTVGEQIKQSVTDAGYYEEVAARYSSAQMIAMMLLALFLAVSLLTDSSLLSVDRLAYFAKDMTTSISMQESVARDTLAYTAQTEPQYALFREGLAVLSKEKLTVFSATGREAIADHVSFATPRLVSSGHYLVAYDLGGHSYRLYNSFDCVKSETLRSPIRAVAAAQNGSYCVITDGEETTSLVTLYNERFRPVNYYHISEYSVCADISDKGQILIGSVSSQNGRLMTHLMLATPGKDRADAQWTVSDAYPVELHFTENGRIMLVCTDAVIWFDGEGRELRRHSFSADALRSLYATEQGCVLVSRANSYDTSTELLSLDKNGKQVYRITLPQSVSDVTLHDGTLGVLTSEELLIFQNGKDAPVDRIPFKGDYGALLTCSPNEFLLCGEAKAIVIRSDKAKN